MLLRHPQPSPCPSFWFWAPDARGGGFLPVGGTLVKEVFLATGAPGEGGEPGVRVSGLGTLLPSALAPTATLPPREESKPQVLSTRSHPGRTTPTWGNTFTPRPHCWGGQGCGRVGGVSGEERGAPQRSPRWAGVSVFSPEPLRPPGGQTWCGGLKSAPASQVGQAGVRGA